MNISNVSSANPYLDSLQNQAAQQQPKHRVDHDGDADDGGAASAASAAASSQPEALEGNHLNTQA